MIQPNVRASFGSEEARWLVRLLAGEDEERREEWSERLEERGVDALLDDAETRRRILSADGISLAPPGLVLYVLVRQSLKEVGVESRTLADYVTALVLEFGREDRARRISAVDDREYDYLVEIMNDMLEADGRRAFLLRSHLGNFALWLSGLFPDHITSRGHRRGGPGIDYYEELGETGYRMAAEDPHAREKSLSQVYREAADRFRDVRRGLNQFSDELLFPNPTAPVDRLLRQARTDFMDGAH